MSAYASVCQRITPCLKRIQRMPNIHLAYISVYQRMSDIFHTLAYASKIRYSVIPPLYMYQELTYCIWSSLIMFFICMSSRFNIEFLHYIFCAFYGYLVIYYTCLVTLSDILVLLNTYFMETFCFIIFSSQPVLASTTFYKMYHFCTKMAHALRCAA